MITNATLDRALVVSDLHLGNPFSEASSSLSGFLEYAARERFHVCINGDGFEILQTSFANLANDSVNVIRRIRALLTNGLSVYYVVGNHDIVLEHYLESWAEIRICPFLNVRSGDQRIRVEHGHLYDPFFVSHPRLYEALTRAAGPVLHVYPDIYKLWSGFERLKDRRAQRSDNNEPSAYHQAAELLLQRGFDTVVFGHTHRAERVELGPNQLYVNSGNWMHGGTYVEIIDGRVELKRWTSGVGSSTTP
ncbi:MAG: UDP-2,3-diacylglucosamine diphosphatase [Myxococcales bacterium]|nr:UDP-2,3-diacylglucosamine diphosphatase [Myxococcales bacterium]